MIRRLQVLFKKRPPENKWFPYEEWRGRGWHEIGEYQIIDYDQKNHLMKVRYVI
jgi:hypothetical protein